jgi:hypothetical protein
LSSPVEETKVEKMAKALLHPSQRVSESAVSGDGAY